MTKNGRSIILGITGSIAAYKACEITSLLKKDGYDVTVILTKEGESFITALTMQTLSGNKIVRDMFELPDVWNPLHTALADKADLILIAPATANIIGKLANGICDDMLSTTVLATKAPVLLAPAMNEKMYKHKVVQANIDKLKNIGYKFVGPIKGRLACGHEDIGHIEEPALIVKEVKRLVK